MAGRAERFGGAFKPLLKKGDQYFIELVLASFTKLREEITEVCGICTTEQEELYQISNSLVLSDNFDKLFFIDRQTEGPLETLQEFFTKNPAWFQSVNLEEPIIICDCDHYLDLSIFDKRLLLSADVILPTWRLKPGENSANWLIVKKVESGLEFAEKPLSAQHDQSQLGVIGCYFFKSISLFKKLITNTQGPSVSDIFKQHILKIALFEVEEASFFGDPKRLAESQKK